MLLLGEVADMIALWIHNYISIGLFKPNQEVHRLKLALDNNR